MPYLSRLILNAQNRQVQSELANPYERHRTIMRAFPERLPEGERVLHRLEQARGGDWPVLLVQSRTAPDWRWLQAGDYLAPSPPGDPLPNPAVKQFALPLRPGQQLLFRLCANPTVKKKRPDQRHGNRVPLKHEEAQREWLARQGRQHGFRLLQLAVTAEGGHSGWVTRKEEQKKERLTLYVVQFDGLLQVTDPARLEQAVWNGVGPAKAFGCGLLSLAPA
jgi:CRISPR system Cascade subunit CasE